MKSLEHKTNLIFDLFFCIIIMPLLIILGPAQYWWRISPLFSSLAIAYLYGCYFTTKILHLPRLILSKSYYKLGGLSLILLSLTYLLTLYPLPEMDFVIPSMSEYHTCTKLQCLNYSVAYVFGSHVLFFNCGFY